MQLIVDDALTYDPPDVINAVRLQQLPAGTGRHPAVEIRHATVAVQKGVGGGVTGGIRKTHHLAQVVDAVSGAVGVAPYVMLGGTDCMHFVPVCDHIYRFTSLVMDESFRAWNTASTSASRSKGWQRW